MKPQLYTILLIIFFSCKSKHTVVANQQIIGRNEYAIFQFDPTDKYPLFKNSQSTSLSDSEIEEIEKIAGAKILEVITNHNKSEKEPDNYVRQYVAAINSEGEKEVWINVFCYNSSDTFWKEEIIYVADGGDCAFNLKVNLSKRTFYDLRINMIA